MSPRHLGLAALCGVLAWLGVEPLRLWPATLVCLAPLVALTLTCTPRVALLRGLLAGLAINLALFAWFIPLIHRFAKFPWIAAIPTGLGLLVWQSIPFALVGWAVARSRRLGSSMLTTLIR